MAGLIEFLNRLNGGYACSRNHIRWAIGVKSIDIHAEALGDTRNIATHVAKGMYAELLTHELCSARSIVEVADSINKKTKSELCHCIGILARRIHRNNIVGSSGSKIDVIVTCASTNDNTKILCCVEDFRINFI